MPSGTPCATFRVFSLVPQLVSHCVKQPYCRANDNVRNIITCYNNINHCYCAAILLVAEYTTENYSDHYLM